MPSSCSNTGRTDLRLTEGQQPNTTATLSCCKSCFAFSANNGQLEAPSTTTGSICFPRTPPLLLISSNANSKLSPSDVSLIAIVPDSECKTPTLTLPLLRSTSLAFEGAVQARDTVAATQADRENILLLRRSAPSVILVLSGHFIFFSLVLWLFAFWSSRRGGFEAAQPHNRTASVEALGNEQNLCPGRCGGRCFDGVTC